MEAFEVFKNLYDLGKITLGMTSAVEAIGESHLNESFYETQARINEERAAFNSAVAIDTGERQVNVILQQTKDDFSVQMAAYGKSGLDYRLGSSQELVATESIGRGLQAAQQAAYESEIRSINEQYKGMSAVHSSRENQRAAGFQTKQAQNSLIENIFKLGDTANSWGASNKTTKSAVAPTTAPGARPNSMTVFMQQLAETGKL